MGEAQVGRQAGEVAEAVVDAELLELQPGPDGRGEVEAVDVRARDAAEAGAEGHHAPVAEFLE